MLKLSDLSTYKTGIYQARAYRNLRHFMERQLQPYDLTSSEWSILGIAYDETSSGGVRISRLGEILDVEVSFITNMVKGLRKRGLVTQQFDEDDGRVRLLIVTAEGKGLVEKIERELRANMKKWLKGIKPLQLISYIQVIDKLSAKTD